MNFSLSASLEDLITRSFYAKDSLLKRQKAYGYGLQSPLWFWSFCGNYSSANEIQSTSDKEQLRLVNLVRWLVLSKRKNVSIALVVPLQWQTVLKQKIAHLLGEVKNEIIGCDKEDDVELFNAREHVWHIEILAHHELSIRKKRRQNEGTSTISTLSAETSAGNGENDWRTNFDVVLYTFGFSPCLENVNLAISQEEYLRDAIQASECSFVLSADIGWTSSFIFSRWREWKLCMDKLSDEPLPISLDPSGLEQGSGFCCPASSPNEKMSGNRLPFMTEKDRIPHLVGKSVPLCCSAHPNQRKMDYGTAPITLQCLRFCLQPFSCGQSNHVCKELCHIYALSGNSHSARQCSYRCDKIMEPCGHRCLKKCSCPCDCFQTIEVPLACSHQIPLGLDKETGETVYGRVDHVYKGSCANASAPCHVEYASECATCAGPIQVLCHEAQEMQHTLAHKTVICDSCQRWTRDLRAEILGSLLCEVEQKRKRLRVEVVQSLHEQQKAAKHGLFLPGERVEIVNSTKCVAPLFDDDFPNIKFLSMEEPDFFTKTQGAYGTFLSSHVDMIDVTQLRHLIQLPSGLHILVTDGGLRLIRPATKLFLENVKKYYLTNSTNNGNDLSAGAVPTTAVLHIEDRKADAQAEGVAQPSQEGVKEFLNSYQGKAVYIPAPISAILSLEDGDERTFSDCFARVLGSGMESPESENNVMVEISAYTLFSIHQGSEENNTQIMTRDEVKQKCKQEEEEKVETEKTMNLNSQRENMRCPSIRTEILHDGPLCRTTYSFFSNISLVEPTDGYEKNDQVNVLRPEHQVRDTYALHLITVAARREFHDDALVISSARLQVDTPYTVVGLLNPPHLGEGYRPLNPLVVLSKSFNPCDVTCRKSDQRVSHHSRGGVEKGKKMYSKPENRTEVHTSLLYFAIPFMFTKCDEESKLEAALDESSHKAFEARLIAAKESKLEDLCLQNEERAFHKLEQLPPVTDEMRSQVRTAYSIPVPIPEEKQLASIQQNYLSMTTASPSQTKTLQLRDTLVKKKEQKMLGGAWIEEVLQRIKLDKSADASHIRSLEVQLSKKSLQLRPARPPVRVNYPQR